MEFNLTYRNILKKAYEASRQKNPAYSVGAFGRLLGIEASRMGQILNGKVGISVKRAINISETLKLSDYDKKLFLLLVQAEHDRNPKVRQEAREKLEKIIKGQFVYNEMFESITDWRHFAVLEYLFLEGVPQDLKAMSNALGLKTDIISNSIELLLSKKIINQTIGDNIRLYEVAIPATSVMELLSSDQMKMLLCESFKNFLASKISQEKKLSCSTLFVRFNRDQAEQFGEKLSEMVQSFKLEIESTPQKNAIGCVAVEFFNLSES